MPSPTDSRNGNGEPLARKILFMIIAALAALVLSAGGAVLANAFSLIEKNEACIQANSTKMEAVRESVSDIKQGMTRIEVLQSEMRDDLKEIKQIRITP